MTNLPIAQFVPPETTISGDMTPSLTLIVVIGVLFATGIYLILERSLSRVLIGIIILGNGVNLLFFVASGQPGLPPILQQGRDGVMSDPLPQALVLTAIVITLGVVSFALAMGYRSWQLNEHDEVQNDLEDRRIAGMAAADLPTVSDDDTSFETRDPDTEAAGVRDDIDDTGNIPIVDYERKENE